MQPNPRNIHADAADDEQRIVREAGEWRARQDAGLDPAAEAEFLRWFETDERHAATFGEMDATWRLLDRASEVSPASLGVASRAPASASPASRSTAATRQRLLHFVLPLAAAAAIAIVFAGKWSRRETPARTPIFNHVANSDGALLKRVNLPDGSVVRLKTDSAIAVSFTVDERRVRLVRGEAHFTVAKSGVPFVVAARGIDVRAVGTAFNVSRREDVIEVLVTEGRVGLERTESRESLLPPRAELSGASSAMSAVLTAGERATITVDYDRELPVAHAAVARISEPEIQQALAWQDRRIQFEDASLAEIVAEFNRFNQHQLVIADATLARLRIGGSFRADDPDTFVHLIETRDGVTAERQPDQTVLRKSP